MKPKVAFIDSGIGGLTLFSKFMHFSNITYVADNRFFPYGVKKESELINIIDRLIFYFLNKHYDKVILSCNTASYIYIKYLRYKYKDSVVSIIESTVNDLENYQNIKNVGILATDKVVQSNIYEKLIVSKYQVKTFSLALSELVSLVENNDQVLIDKFLEDNLTLLVGKIDVLILACTHFNIIEENINRIFKGKIPIICSGYSLINRLKNNLLCLSCCREKIYLTNFNEDYVKKIHNLFNELKNIEIKSLNI